MKGSKSHLLKSSGHTRTISATTRFPVKPLPPNTTMLYFLDISNYDVCFPLLRFEHKGFIAPIMGWRVSSVIRGHSGINRICTDSKPYAQIEGLNRENALIVPARNARSPRPSQTAVPKKKKTLFRGFTLKQLRSRPAHKDI